MIHDVRMIVTDLDRTLLTDDKKITPYTASVLAHCRESGIKVVFATARPWRTTAPYLADVSVDAVICHNGAATFIDGEQIDSHVIPMESARSILNLLKEALPDATLSIEIDDALYANFKLFVTWEYTPCDFCDLTTLPDGAAYKIICTSDQADMFEKVVSLLPDDMYAQMCDGRLCLIMNRAAAKWNAVRALAERFSIPIERIAAFGDDLNDIDMLRNCGYGIAVSNALGIVRNAADSVCGFNEEDGVAHWLESVCIVATGSPAL